MVFITGSSGLVGGHLLIHLLQKGEKVRALRRESTSFAELEIICRYYQMDFSQVMRQTEWVTGDLLDRESLLVATNGVETVYHCAAVVSFDNTSPDELLRINIEGTRNMLDVSIRQQVSCFAFVSSIGALGQSEDGVAITEETPWNPDNQSSVYSNSKYAAEQEVWNASRKGLNVVIVNPGVILGTGNSSKGSLQFFSIVRKGMPFYTCQQTGYVDVRDVCRALLLLVNKQLYNERYILVSENLDIKQLFSLIAGAMGKKPPFIGIGQRTLHFAGWLAQLVSRITGKSPWLTPEIIRSATKRESYSSQKMIKDTGFEFTPIKECIMDAVTFQQ